MIGILFDTDLDFYFFLLFGCLKCILNNVGGYSDPLRFIQWN